MNIQEVIDISTRKRFLNLVDYIYKDDLEFVRPLNDDIEAVFDPLKNEYLQHGEIVRYILNDSNGKTIGRIAVFINRKKAFGFDQPTGGVGFFECINDQKAANTLFNTAKNWLQERGMEAMDGPINFGENENYWGLLVQGYTAPAYGMNYHPSYYKALFEAYGFKTYFEQITKHLDLTKPFPERFWKIAEWVVKKKEYHFEHYSIKNSEKYVNDFVEIYNDAWQFHENFTKMNPQIIRDTLYKAKSILREDFIWFAYHNNEPIGLLAMFPDINPIVKQMNGKLNLYSKLKFWWLTKGKTITRARVVILGIKTKFQKSGIESGIFYQLKKVMEKLPWYTELELSWVGDFNPKMRKMLDIISSKLGKRHITYRYLFNSNTEKQIRSTIIPVNTKDKAK